VFLSLFVKLATEKYERLLQKGESTTNLRLPLAYFPLASMELWLNMGVAIFLYLKEGVFSTAEIFL
jgi:hypothetical protein